MDFVDHPGHYTEHFPFEASEAIEAILHMDQCRGLKPIQYYYLGCALKYRLRAGLKDDAEQDIAKSLKYMEMFDECG